MQIVTLVNRDIGRAVRAAADRTTSPYFAAALLTRHLAPLHSRLQLLAVRRPLLWSDLAEHLGVPADFTAVTAEVDRRATALLTRRLDADTRAPAGHHNRICSP